MIGIAKQVEICLDRLEAIPECRVQLITGHGNVGYGRGHNLAIDQAKGEYHLVLNPDVIIDQVAITEGIRYLTNEDEIGLVAPLVRDDKGKSAHLCKRYPTVFALLLRGLGIPSLNRIFSSYLGRYEMSDLDLNDSYPNIIIVSGCFMLFKMAILREVGGFSNRYFLYFEDFEISIKTSQVSKIVFSPKIKITHFGGKTARKGFKQIFFFIRSAITFFNNNGWRWF